MRGCQAKQLSNWAERWQKSGQDFGQTSQLNCLRLFKEKHRQDDCAKDLWEDVDRRITK